MGRNYINTDENYSFKIIEMIVGKGKELRLKTIFSTKKEEYQVPDANASRATSINTDSGSINSSTHSKPLNGDFVNIVIDILKLDNKNKHSIEIIEYDNRNELMINKQTRL